MNNIMIRRLLYAFKRQWGTVFDYVQILTSEVDDRTGSRNIKRDVLRLPAVLLPQSQLRKFIQDIGYLAADKNFTYGGLNDFNTITLLVDRFDAPSQFRPDLNGYINHDYKRFERVSISDIFGECYLLVARGVEGGLPYARLDDRTFNRLQLQQRVTYELN